jgi:hypothetical protein
VAAELGVEPVPSFAALLLGDLTLVTDVPELLGLPRAEVDGWDAARPAPVPARDQAALHRAALRPP